MQDFISQLSHTAESAPESCTSEECILQWLMSETQNIQMIYDLAVAEGFGYGDEVEELYRHKLQEVLEIALAALGAREL